MLLSGFEIYFNPRSPWGERRRETGQRRLRDHFNPRSPRGERLAGLSLRAGSSRFQSTLPVGGSDHSVIVKLHKTIRFQSTLPVGGATVRRRENPAAQAISIHAPRGGSDLENDKKRLNTLSISIHAPRGGSDQSSGLLPQMQHHFNPRSPWGERPYTRPSNETHNSISIHAPRGGSDAVLLPNRLGATIFQSTLPAGGATLTIRFLNGILLFQSTLPAGGATLTIRFLNGILLFQSTLPAGGATGSSAKQTWSYYISIHAPRGGSDPKLVPILVLSEKFQSTLPAGGATQTNDVHADFIKFQSTLPAGGATQTAALHNTKMPISIHAPRGGSDLPMA